MHLVSPRFNDESVLATMNLRRAILLTTVLMVQEGATSTNVPASRLSLKAWLQKCHSPQDVLNFIEENLNTNSDPLGAISSLCLCGFPSNSFIWTINIDMRVAPMHGNRH
jgi:hypothetical protein